MKKIILIILFGGTLLFGQNTFNKGINLTNWFQVDSPRKINFKKYTKTDFRNIKTLGCDVIRLPVFLHAMADSSKAYEIDTLFLSFLDSAVNWAEELNLNIILDNHTFDPSINTKPEIRNALIPIWRNMAEHYKNRSMLLYYEILNEPHGISTDVWNSIQQEAIDAIREIDSVHTIIVGSADWTGYVGLKDLPVYEDTNLIYTFHFYDPMIFTHQGADWVTPSLTGLGGIPFPYGQSPMPDLPSQYLNTWIEYSYNNYYQDGTEQKVKELLKIATDFRDERNVKIYCGEFGVYKFNANNQDRVNWYKLFRETLEKENIPWTMWDYQYGFGLFNNNYFELFQYDLNIPLVEALGFNSVPQLEYKNEIEEGPFTVYDDFIGSKVNSNSWVSKNSVLDFYSSDNPAVGKYSIFWTEAELYNNISFDFSPDKNFSYSDNEANPMAIVLWLKGDTPDTKIDIRFIDSKTDDPNDHPWRMGTTIEEGDGDFRWDNQWRKIIIPFSDLVEQGAWDNEQWYNPIGNFDWSAVDQLQIVAEHHSLVGRKIWIDDIVIKSINVLVNDNYQNLGFKLEQNYPNPFNPSTVINYSIPNKILKKSGGLSIVKLRVYDVLGREVATLVNKEQAPGNYNVTFNADNMTSGIYFYKLQYGGFIESKKMLLLK